MITRPLVIVHSNCLDGLGAAVCAQLAMQHLNVEIVQAFYGQEPPDVSGRNVLVFDFSYPRNILIDMHAKAASLKVFDHHDSAQKDLEGLEFAYFDQTKSGATLAWDYFNVGKSVPMILQYIQDRDLWQWKLPKSREVNACIRQNVAWTTDAEFQAAIGQLAMYVTHGDIDTMADIGTVILRITSDFVDHCVKHSFYLTVPLVDGDITVLAAFAQNKIGSEVGGALAKLSPSGCGMVITSPGSDSGTKFGLSLRGVPETDVAQRVAKHYGGGGHLCAAGAGITLQQFQQLMSTMTMLASAEPAL